MAESDHEFMPKANKSRKRWVKDRNEMVPYRTYLKLAKSCQEFGLDINTFFPRQDQQAVIPVAASSHDHDENLSFSENGSESSDDDGNDDDDDNYDSWVNWNNIEGASQLNVNIAHENELLEILNAEQPSSMINDDDYDNVDENEDDDDDDDDDMSINHVYSEKLIATSFLYPGCKTTVDKVVLELMDIYIKKKLTKSTLVCLLQLFQLILPEANTMPKTIYQLFKFVKQRSLPEQAIKHYYFQNCREYKESATQTLVCNACKESKDTGFFYELDISNQIKFLFEYRNLADKLQPFNEPREQNIIADIQDGSEYKRVNSTPDRQQYDLTLILNTDGLSLVKSAKSNCWPLMFMIAELPPELRENYLVVVGLWYDSQKKPLMNTFLKPFCLKLKKCYEEGIQWTDAKTKQIYISKVAAPLFNADAPARAEILHMLSFNGKFGCNICEIMTSKCQPIEGKKAIRIFAFKKNQNQLRTDKKMREQAKKADGAAKTSRNTKGTHVKGLKGTSIISVLPLLSLGTCVTPEYMHSMLLGVGKQFLNLWINVKGAWNVSRHGKSIEAFIKNIRPPSFFHRMPRTIFVFHQFKAWEVLVWILYYSVPTLAAKLPDLHLQHWMLFVRAIYILIQDRISSQDLREAEECLQEFVKDIKKLYNDRAYTYNVHQMLHLVLCVERWGPLHLTSAFFFENHNGFLSHCVHGTKHQGEEIVKYISIAQGTQILRSYCTDNGQEIREKKKFTLTGKAKKSDGFINEYEQIVLTNYQFYLHDMMIYGRAKFNKLEFSSQFYKKTKTNSCFVKIKIRNEILYGSIRFFFKNENSILIMLQHFTVDPEKFFVNKKITVVLNHILPIIMNNQYSILAADDIESIYHLVEVGDYVCDQPNHFSSVC